MSASSIRVQYTYAYSGEEFIGQSITQSGQSCASPPPACRMIKKSQLWEQCSITIVTAVHARCYKDMTSVPMTLQSCGQNDDDDDARYRWGGNFPIKSSQRAVWCQRFLSYTYREGRRGKKVGGWRSSLPSGLCDPLPYMDGLLHIMPLNKGVAS